MMINKLLLHFIWSLALLATTSQSKAHLAAELLKNAITSFSSSKRNACVLLASNMMALAPLAVTNFYPSISYAATEEVVAQEETSLSTSPAAARLPKNFRATSERISESEMMKKLQRSMDKINTMKAYLDEAETNIFLRKWTKLSPYLYTFSEQDKDFALLISQLFPNTDALDASAREALSFEARSIFLALDDLKEAAKDKDYDNAEASYAKLLLSYDRFLKAGGLYDTYDEITSTAVFFTKAPLETWRYDAKSKVGVQDKVILTTGPDMGKTGNVIHLEGNNAIVKLDKNGRNYQEVKIVKQNTIAKALSD
jgi:hypothetical protein